MSSQHDWVIHAVGEYLVLVWLTAALAALCAAFVLKLTARIRGRLSGGVKAPDDSLPRAGRAGA